ncbi:uncharacterized protein PAS_chr3_0578 [Komagataella phaffii GS115]|uniref:Peroxisomal nudix pyrophosphatase with specificity for coenzyme A and CoA derivatives, may function n=2 Tax=Komagataella phaffii TaxID=460519 RepID=C4R4Z0_KOMPG|nr:uncharacterized protein PAS_chr3_0578 [Komagataella phaffii GS115]KAI0463708.1 hypothetical protein LJB42_002713 [Komagataella kurtzmanii]CAY70626.1 Peroxisomal nudix pyrophosphatase with specificity for coenzyme A and CoA derivatives, may function [Komagataella phaffii GS115]
MESKYLTNIAKYSPVYHGSQIQTSIWPQLPLARRASVMVLLFLGKMGELRVILTRRSKKLRAFSGHISLPGGKADTLDETEWDVARRETEEEIGISADDDYLKSHSGFTIHKINTLPAYLSRTFLGVRPCVGFIDFHHASNKAISSILLNPGESSAIFSVPLKDFLQPKPRRYELKECLKQSYIKTKWGGIPWNLRSFIFPIHNPHEVPWLESIQDLSSEEDETEQDMEFGEKTRNVWGLTANILRDLAMLTYGGAKHFHELVGEEDLIHSLATVGKQMQGRPRSEFEKTMTNNRRGVGFDQVLPDHEVQRLKTLYSVI